MGLRVIGWLAIASAFACSTTEKPAEQPRATTSVVEISDRPKHKIAEPEPFFAANFDGNRDHIPKDPNIDLVIARVGHLDPKPGDPVHVVFDEIEIISATIPSASSLKGGRATFTIGVGSLKTGIDDRDAHLKSPDFFNIAAEPLTAQASVSGIRHFEDGYTAFAELTLGAIKKTFEVTFVVVPSPEGTIRIQGKSFFKRSDLGIGDGIAGPADDVEIFVQLTFPVS